jgi:hypothetical protein
MINEQSLHHTSIEKRIDSFFSTYLFLSPKTIRPGHNLTIQSSLLVDPLTPVEVTVTLEKEIEVDVGFRPRPMPRLLIRNGNGLPEPPTTSAPTTTTTTPIPEPIVTTRAVLFTKEAQDIVLPVSQFIFL